MANEKQYLGWHFLREDRKLCYEDGREVKVGETLSVLDDSKPLELCEYGMHASLRPLDALKYAPGGVCCRVILSGDVVTGNDKMVGKCRTVLWMVDAEKILQRWALDCAKSVHHLTDDLRVANCIELTEKYLNGDGGVSEENLRTAARAACAAGAYAAVYAVEAAYAGAYAAASTATYAATAAASAASVADYEAIYKERLTELDTDLENRIIQAAKDGGCWVEDPQT